MNRIEINFVECDPTPPKGYEVFWRVKGSSDPLVSAGIFFTSPVIFFDTTNPDGTDFEGYIESIYSNMVCAQIPWETGVTSGSSTSGGGGGGIQYVYHAEIYLCTDCSFPVGETTVGRIGLPATLGRYYGSTNTPGTIVLRPIYEIAGGATDILVGPGLLTCVLRCAYEPPPM